MRIDIGGYFVEDFDLRETTAPKAYDYDYTIDVGPGPNPGTRLVLIQKRWVDEQLQRYMSGLHGAMPIEEGIRDVVEEEVLRRLVERLRG